jgi:hypothetical protein
MKDMVVNFLPSGEIQHTLKDSMFKPEFGTDREIVRMTLIEPTRDGRYFYIIGKVDPVNQLLFTVKLLAKYGIDVCSLGVGFNIADGTGTVYFRSYEDAVTAEIAAINAMRLAGVILSHPTHENAPSEAIRGE